jgi:hypothetical protein
MLRGEHIQELWGQVEKLLKLNKNKLKPSLADRISGLEDNVDIEEKSHDYRENKMRRCEWTMKEHSDTTKRPNL